MATKKKSKSSEKPEKAAKAPKAEKGETKKKVRKKAAGDGVEGGNEAGEGVEKKKTKRKARAKKIVLPDRFKLYWGVFNHAMKRVSLFEFNQRKAAEKRADELSEGGKPPHFVQKVKELIAPVAVEAEA